MNLEWAAVSKGSSSKQKDMAQGMRKGFHLHSENNPIYHDYNP